MIRHIFYRVLYSVNRTIHFAKMKLMDRWWKKGKKEGWVRFILNFIHLPVLLFLSDHIQDIFKKKKNSWSSPYNLVIKLGHSISQKSLLIFLWLRKELKVYYMFYFRNYTFLLIFNFSLSSQTPSNPYMRNRVTARS